MTGDQEPVVIGGLGGSGTRLAAHLVRELGFHLGDHLNFAFDNLWFAFLFRRPNWYRANPEQVPVALRLFEKAMRGNTSFEAEEEAVLQEAVRQQGSRAVELARSMRGGSGIPADAAGWGWKNPSTHVFIDRLAASFPGMRYIHLIRNGLELVGKAKLARQVSLWGPQLGIDPPPDTAAPAPPAALRYWVRANRRALTLGPRLFGDRFLLLRYESLCEKPEDAVSTVAGFLGVHAIPAAVDRFSAFIDVPSAGRDRSSMAGRMDPRDLAEVEAMGFRVR